MKSSNITFFLNCFILSLNIACSQITAWDKANQLESSLNYINVIATNPSDGETYVSTNTDITITFSDNIAESTLTASSIQVDNDVTPAEILYNSVTKTVMYIPQNALAQNTKFTVTLTKDIKNPADENLSENYSWSFTTNSELAPEISIFEGEFPVNTGDIYDFGTILDTETRSKTFTINNSGTGDLIINGISLDGIDSGEFAIDTGSMATTLAPGSQTGFTVTFDPSSTGIKNASLTVNNNDNNETSYTFYLKGYASASLEPEIMLKQDLTEYIIGDNYDFGTILAGTSSPEVTFTIYNIGNTDLEIGNFTLEGQNSEMFILDTSGTSETVAPGSSTAFTARFAPDTAKVVLVRVLIENNDSDENPFMFKFKARSY